VEESLELFEKSSTDPKLFSPLVLAFLGDAVYELIVRSMLVNKANKPVNKLHKESSSFANAKTQSKFAQILCEHLSEEELRIYKRGRNTHSHSVAKNASIGDYRQATGFEALLGYLYLQKRHDRIKELIYICLKEKGES
jgi:cysteine--tRNA ligase